MAHLTRFLCKEDFSITLLPSLIAGSGIRPNDASFLNLYKVGFWLLLSVVGSIIVPLAVYFAVVSEYSEPSLQRQHLFPKMLPLK